MTITDLLQNANVATREVGGHHHATHGRIQTDCPYCSPNSNKFRLGIALSGTHSSCWTCGAKPIGEALHLLTGLAYRDIKKVLGNLPAVRQGVRHRGRLELPKGLGPLLKQHRDYLRSRNFDPDILQKLWGIQGIGLAAELAWRIFIPIILEGQTISWTTRGLTDDGKRYHSARPDQEAISHKETIFGVDYCRHSIVVVEGPLDAIAIGPGAGATMGQVYTTQQLRMISRFAKKAVCFDNQPDAQRRAMRLCRDLDALSPGATTNVILDAKDPGSAGKKEIKLLRKAFLE